MKPIESPPPEKSKAPAVDGAFDIMQTLVQSTYPLSLTEIADRVNMPVASCHRIINALLRRGLVVQDLQRRKSYCMGAMLFQMASAAYFQQPIVPLFHSIADVLKNELHQSINLSVLAGSHTLVVAHVPWPFVENHGVYVGLSNVLHRTAAGKAMMSMHPVTIQKQYWETYIADRESKADNAGHPLEAWLHELSEIRRVGYALTKTETLAGVFTLAAPVLNRRGEPLAAMAVCFDTQRDIRATATPLIQATWQLSARLG
ncbi:IclR family transcriptional regulator [Caballeronia novacaledonica]|uniref:IclR family transcriptional regulator n=1 Tax=Caballeronia novacaledonica TaxID=1544861 RepID=A0A2U3I612_9BURK|nr:IclR family transcriptional regulator [Caballeronia novacaledonica]